MDVQKVDLFMMQNRDRFKVHDAMVIREKLLTLDDSKQQAIFMVELKDPTMMLIISIFLGYLGIYARRCPYGYFETADMWSLRNTSHY